MNPFATPNLKREYAETVALLFPEMATRVLGVAVSMEAGRYDEYQDAHDAWEAAEPHPKDFSSPEGLAEVAAAKERWDAAVFR